MSRSTALSVRPDAAPPGFGRIGRRALLLRAGGAGLAGSALLARPRPARATLPVPPSGGLAFAIMREGSRIGTHSVGFREAGGALTVTIAVDIAVGIGPLTLFRYTHNNVERWQDGVLLGFDAKTNDNGTPAVATATRGEGGLVVEGTKAPRYTAPPDALAATHWNRAELAGPMISTQDGRLFHPRVVDEGAGAVTLADGGTLPANRYALTGDLVLTLWYAADGSWASLEFHADDGTTVTYQRL